MSSPFYGNSFYEPKMKKRFPVIRKALPRQHSAGKRTRPPDLPVNILTMGSLLS